MTTPPLRLGSIGRRDTYVSPLLVINRVSDNVGGVKQFSSTLPHALGEERHFALEENCRGWPTFSVFAKVGRLDFRRHVLFFARGEAAFHASQPGDARNSARTETVALEQLSGLCSRRSGTGADQPMGSSDHSAKKRNCTSPSLPTFAKQKSQRWATRGEPKAGQTSRYCGPN
jgi:hypothetical protein